MKKETLNHEESLRLIEEMISVAKNKLNENGFHFMLWGVLISCCSLLQYLVLTSYLSINANILWLTVFILGGLAAMVYEIRKSRVNKPITKFDSIYHKLWMAFGVTLFLTIYLCIKLHIVPTAFIMLLAGLATFVSGAIYNFKPLIAGGIVFWIGAFVCSFLNNADQLLLNSFVLIIGYIIPGLLLWKKFKLIEHV